MRTASPDRKEKRMKNKKILPLQTDADIILRQSPETLTTSLYAGWKKKGKKSKPDILFD